MSDWYTRGACRGADPDWFVLAAGHPTTDNIKAQRMCHDCPVRVDCRDDALGGEPTSIIAGGWRWTAKGKPRPFPGDEHLAGMTPRAPKPKPAPKPKQPNRGRPPGPPDVDRFLAAGRAAQAGNRVGEVAQRFGISRYRVYAAAMVLEEKPDLAELLAAGQVTIRGAEMAARAARRERKAA